MNQKDNLIVCTELSQEALDYLYALEKALLENATEQSQNQALEIRRIINRLRDIRESFDYRK
jgi:hypothetical protein